MKKNKLSFIYLLMILALIISACNLPSAGTPPTDELTTAEATHTPAATQTLAPAEITHLIQPINSTLANNQLIPDCDTGIRSEPTRPSIRQGCETWPLYYLERPANLELNQYLPNFDILQAQMGQDGEWYYAWLKLYETAVVYDPYASTYGFEFDINFDNRGDVLMIVNGLPVENTEWTTEGLQVWLDKNGDVGGDAPMEPDKHPGDGYETLIFDSGKGDDADLAWVRRAPQAANQIEFAFKPSMLNNAATFAWWGWAYTSSITPAQFEILDSFERNEKYELDNTCSWVFGGPLQGLINQCNLVPPTPLPEQQGCEITTPRPSFLHFWDPVNCQWTTILFVFPTPTEIIIK